MKKSLLAVLTLSTLLSTSVFANTTADVHDIYIKAKLADVGTSNNGQNLVIFERTGFELEYTSNTCLSGGWYASMIVNEQNQLSRLLYALNNSEQLYLLAKVNCNATVPKIWLNKIIKDQEELDAMTDFENNPPIITY